MLEILGAPPIAIEPYEGAFDDPSARQDLEAACNNGSLDDRDGPFADPAQVADRALRNRDPILVMLRTILPPTGIVLEVASGSGEHVLHFANALPGITWQPSDPSAQARASIAAWLETKPRHNVLEPLDLDATSPVWPIERADAVIAINLLHISPWEATLGLLRHASWLLPAGGPLFLYGPFDRAGEPLAPSNVAFDGPSIPRSRVGH